jgi:peptide/nickel transport system substrate-binding protein
MNSTRRDTLRTAGAIGLLAALGRSGAGLAATPKRGGALHSIVNPEPPSVIGAFNQLLPTVLVSTKMFQGLLRYSFDLKPLPCLAKSWTVSPDGLVYTFALEPNVTWHDGAPFTADDVVFSTATMLPQTSPRWRSIFSRCSSIKAVDPHTVEFTLKEPFNAFLLGFPSSGCPMMPKHIYDKDTNYRANPANEKPIGTGPFKFQEWRKGSFVHLVRNENYWKPGQPYLDEIFYNIIPDGAQRVAAVETGRVDMAQNDDIEAFEVPRLRELEHLEFIATGNEALSPVSWMDVNLRLPKFQDKRFRKAMMHAIDRQFIVDNLYFGLGRVANGPVATTTRFSDQYANVKYPYDPAKAIALMDEMGLKPDAGGIRQRVKILALPWGEVWTRQAELVKQQFAKVGIEATIENTDSPGYLQRNTNWDYELCFDFLGQFMDPAIGVSRGYLSANIVKSVYGFNTEGYVNSTVDSLFARAGTMTSTEEAQKLYSEVQHIISDEVPVLYLVEMQFPIFANRRLHDAVIDAAGPHGDFDQAYKTA